MTEPTKQDIVKAHPNFQQERVKLGKVIIDTCEGEHIYNHLYIKLGLEKVEVSLNPTDPRVQDRLKTASLLASTCADVKTSALLTIREMANHLPIDMDLIDDVYFTAFEQQKCICLVLDRGIALIDTVLSLDMLTRHLYEKLMSELSLFVKP